jgi:anti-sigma factor RsiW
VSHLADAISALVDGELSGAELDRANAHLAACGRCRAEAAALRRLKRELRALAAPGTTPDPAADRTGGQAGVRADDALTRRLLAMAGPGGPVPSRRSRHEQFRREQRGGPQGSVRVGPPGRAGPQGSKRRRPDAPPYGGRPPGASRRRGRYVVLSAVSLVVVGIGTAAFSMGGSSADPGPKITPQLGVFSVEHAITSGDVPFPDPAQAPTERP